MNNFLSNVGKNLAKEISQNLLMDKNSHIFRVNPTLSDFETFSKASKASVKPGKAGGHDNITSISRSQPMQWSELYQTFTWY